MGLDNDLRFVKDSTSNAEEMWDSIEKNNTQLCMLHSFNKEQYSKVPLHIQ
jgi:hypothetical protein